MDRRDFITTLGSAVAMTQLGCASAPTTGSRQLKRVGVQLYSLRDDARRDLERTLADIAQAGYNDVELLGSMKNFEMPPATLRKVLDRNGLRAPSTHVGGNALDNLSQQLDEAATLGHQYVVVASLPIEGTRTVAEYQRWADKLNEAGRIARQSNVWIGFHNHADDFEVPGAYEALVARTDAKVVRLQLDTGNLAMAGLDPIEYLKRYGDRYWLFHIKDVPALRAKNDAELGKGIIDFRKLLAGIDRIDEKFLFVEQETYPGAPLDSVRRDFSYISSLRF